MTAYAEGQNAPIDLDGKLHCPWCGGSLVCMNTTATVDGEYWVCTRCEGDAFYSDGEVMAYAPWQKQSA